MTKEEALYFIKTYGFSCDDKICDNCSECISEKFTEAVKTIEAYLNEID